MYVKHRQSKTTHAPGLLGQDDAKMLSSETVYTWNLPLSQNIQFDIPTSPYFVPMDMRVPAGHFTHSRVVAVGLYWPVEQKYKQPSEEFRATIVENVPRGHATHSFADTVLPFEYVSGGQLTQESTDAAPSDVESFPLGHRVQVLIEVDAVALLYVPCGHCAHAVVVFPENVPAEHGVHIDIFSGRKKYPALHLHTEMEVSAAGAQTTVTFPLKLAAVNSPNFAGTM